MVSEWGNPLFSDKEDPDVHRGGNLGNWNILVPKGKEINKDSVSSGERNRNSPNLTFMWGSCRVSNTCSWRIKEYLGIDNQREWKSRIWNLKRTNGIPEYHGTRYPVGIWGEPPSKAKYPARPIVNQYREGKVKSPRKREWNSTWNCLLTNRESPAFGGMISCLLKNEPASFLKTQA